LVSPCFTKQVPSTDRRVMEGFIRVERGVRVLLQCKNLTT
jgi:hypothetical protein